MGDLRTDERGLTPVVSKALVIGIALLYVGGVTSLLFGGVAPEYRTAAGEELAERTLATAVGEIERTVPEANGTVDRSRAVRLPERIREKRYRLELSGTSLRLDHPDPEIGTRARLSIPSDVHVSGGSWRSGNTLEIRVTGPPDNRTLEIDP